MAAWGYEGGGLALRGSSARLAEAEAHGQGQGRQGLSRRPPRAAMSEAAFAKRLCEDVERLAAPLNPFGPSGDTERGAWGAWLWLNFGGLPAAFILILYTLCFMLYTLYP